MSDLRITEKFNMPLTTPQMRGDNTNTIKPVSKENKELSTGVKIATGIGLVALASYGIYVATRGKIKPKKNPITTPHTSPVTSKNPNFFEQKGLKINKEIVSNADGTLYTGTLEHVNKNGEKFILKYKDGTLQTSEKYTMTGELVLRKKYTQEIANCIDSNRQPYSVMNKRMYIYNKDGKIIGGAAVIRTKNAVNYVNNKYCIYKDNKEVIKTRYASKDGKERVLFEKPLENESDARYLLGTAPLASLGSPLKAYYPLSK